MGGKGALNYLPIVPKASIYVPKVMHKPVMGGNTVSETFTHMFLFRSVSSFEKRPRQPIWRAMDLMIMCPSLDDPKYAFN